MNQLDVLMSGGAGYLEEGRGHQGSLNDQRLFQVRGRDGEGKDLDGGVSAKRTGRAEEAKRREGWGYQRAGL